MSKVKFLKRATLTTTVAAVLTASIAASLPSLAVAQTIPAVAPANDVTLSVGAGTMVRLNGTMTDLFVADDRIADVQVRSADQIYLFGKRAGETTVYATNKAGRVVYSANVRVGTNIGSVDELLRVAMPEAQIKTTPMNGVVLLTGTVAAPSDSEEAQRIVQAYVGKGTQVISRLKTATPLQVNLQVKIAEVSRSLTKTIGMNILAADSNFGFGQGSAIDVETGKVAIPKTGSVLRLAGNVLGLDVISALELAEGDGRVTTLAEPNLTALSGETASFLAGGEFPIAIASGINGTSVQFKEYGVSLAFTPVVLEGGRISMRVRPEVSELSAAGAIKIDGMDIPALTTRRAETTVELGSGQSFMLGGLIRNSTTNNTDKAPWLGDLPILGALFRSKSFKRDESELVIIVTPYLVKPVNAGNIALPTDGYRVADDAERFLLNKQQGNPDGRPRPQPTLAPAPVVVPSVGAVGSAQMPPQPAAPQPTRQAQQKAVRPQATASVAPGFSF